MSIYQFAMHYHGISKIKQIHSFATDYLGDWFPDLGSYQNFNNGPNRISFGMNTLVESLCSDFVPEDTADGLSLLDSMPIVTCSDKHIGKVAREITNKGYCSTKKMYYCGMMLHALLFCH